MDDSEKTLQAIVQRHWRVVLLAPRSKRPQGVHWTVLTGENIAAIRRHLEDGGNIGLVCGPHSGIAVLDFDEPGALSEMATQLGVPPPWVETGSGKLHCYIQWEDNLPSKILWKGVRVGEVQRGGPNNLQHVVIPPSIHPDTGQPYRWIVDPIIGVPSPLPEVWKEHLNSEVIPDFMVGDELMHPEPEEWDGPPPEAIVQWAMTQPGAKRRRNGVKFQCPGCRAEGHDKSRDNAVMYYDGRWGCALDPNHRRYIMDEILADLAPKQADPEAVEATRKHRVEEPSADVLNNVINKWFK